MPNQQPTAADNGRHTATCPECGATVPVLGGHWLAVHHEGSPDYVYPRGFSERCFGSLLTVHESEESDR